MRNRQYNPNTGRVEKYALPPPKVAESKEVGCNTTEEEKKLKNLSHFNKDDIIDKEQAKNSESDKRMEEDMRITQDTKKDEKDNETISSDDKKERVNFVLADLQDCLTEHVTTDQWKCYAELYCADDGNHTGKDSLPPSFQPWALNPPDHDERTLIIQCLSYAVNKVFTRKDDNPDIIDDCENHLVQINSTEQTMVDDGDRISSKTLVHNDYKNTMISSIFAKLF